MRAWPNAGASLHSQLHPWRKAHGPPNLLFLSHAWDNKSETTAVLRTYALADGKAVWSYRPLTTSAHGAATRETLYLPGSRHPAKPKEAGGLFAFDSGSGQLLWSYVRAGLRFGAPAISQSQLFVVGSDGHLYAFRATGGMQRSHATAEE